MKRIAVLYHKSDADGILSAIIARKYISARNEGEPKMFPCEYGDIPVEFNQENFDLIYVIDFSDDALFANELTRNKIIWIDHHKTAIEKKYGIKCFCIDGVAACRLTQQFFAGLDYPFLTKENFVDRDIIEPLFVCLVGEYDIWDSDSVNAKPLNFGLKKNWEDIEKVYNSTIHCLAHEFKKGTEHTHLLDRVSSQKILLSLINKGIGAIQHIGESSTRLNGGRKIELLGHTGVAFNCDTRSSLVCPIIKDDFIMVWNITDSLESIQVSIYSERIDVSRIALHYGGGGHRGAAGFRINFDELKKILKL